MSFVFHPDAELELNEAIEWYETREPGLGLDFATQVYAAIQRAQAFPLAWQEMDGNIRRALVHRFPYGVLYATEQDQLMIIAVHAPASPTRLLAGQDSLNGVISLSRMAEAFAAFSPDYMATGREFHEQKARDRGDFGKGIPPKRTIRAMRSCSALGA